MSEEVAGVGEDVGALLAGMYISSHCENSMEGPQNIKNNCHMTQQCHF